MRWVLYPIAALFALAILGIATLAAMAFFAWPKLPALDTLTDYRPRVPLRVYTADGHLIGEFGETVVIDWGLAKDLDQAVPEDSLPAAAARGERFDGAAPERFGEVE